MDAKQKYDAKQKRRKQNRALRKHGLELLPMGAHTTTASKLDRRAQIGAMQKRAEHDVRLRCKLSHNAIHADTMNERAAAAKAKRKLSDVWTNRVSRNLTGFWRPV